MTKTYAAEDVARGLRAIAAADGSIRQAAKDTGYPRMTLRAWQAGRRPRGATTPSHRPSQRSARRWPPNSAR